MPYGKLSGLAPSISDRTALTLCVEPRTAKALHGSSAEPPSSRKSPDSVISNWQTGDILIRHLHTGDAESIFWKIPTFAE